MGLQEDYVVNNKTSPPEICFGDEKPEYVSKNEADELRKQRKQKSATANLSKLLNGG